MSRLAIAAPTLAYLAIGLSSPAQVLNPGDLFYPGIDHQGSFGGSVIAGPTSVAYSSDAFSGEIFSLVLSGDPANPFGGFTFAYKISNSGADSLTSFHVYNGFHDLHTAVADFLGAGGTPPVSAARSTLAGDSGNGILFSYQDATPGLGGGQATAWLFVHTDSSAYHAGSTILSGYHDPLTTPVIYLDGILTPVPEPTVVASVAGLGLVAFALARRHGSRRTRP